MVSQNVFLRGSTGSLLHRSDIILNVFFLPFSDYFMLRKPFNEMSLKHFYFKSEGNEENLFVGSKLGALLGKSGAIIPQTEKFSFISKGLTPCNTSPFILSLCVKLISYLETLLAQHGNE